MNDFKESWFFLNWMEEELLLDAFEVWIMDYHWKVRIGIGRFL